MRFLFKKALNFVALILENSNFYHELLWLNLMLKRRNFSKQGQVVLLQDFATPSLTEEKKVFFTKDAEELERKEIEQFTFRRRWESR